MNVKTIIFPSSYFSDSLPDEDLQSEYAAATETGLFETVLFSNDKWFSDEKLVLDNIPHKPQYAVYRGWMMKPELYGKFYDKLREKNIRLLTAPSAYEKFHIFPNIYHELENDTAKMLVFPNSKNIDLEKIKSTFSKFMVKDFVKSVKGTDFPKYFDLSVTNDEFDRQMELFCELRGNLYTGGICIKEFLKLKKYYGFTNEFRVFYINNKIASVSRNSMQPLYAPEPPEKLIEKYAKLDSPFYTVDYAQTQDGEWKIIEAGDGQVSGLSPGQDNYTFFKSLYYCMN
ncbi:MAG: ATP-grasp domain-containing protein [Oscillospiraceae bacterium]|nr:ATP-grasp domain-containing protein [Oscillospiraceae bacterium]